VDVWYLDDGTIFTRPGLAIYYLGAYDRVTGGQGGKRNLKKTRVIVYATPEQLAAHWEEWHIWGAAGSEQRGKP
jgi:hypothetical protein